MKKYLVLAPVLAIAFLSSTSQPASANFFNDILDGVKKAGTDVGETALKGVVQIGKDAYADRFKWAGVVVNGVALTAQGVAAGASGQGVTSGPRLTVKPLDPQ